MVDGQNTTSLRNRRRIAAKKRNEKKGGGKNEFEETKKKPALQTNLSVGAGKGTNKTVNQYRCWEREEKDKRDNTL